EALPAAPVRTTPACSPTSVYARTGPPTLVRPVMNPAEGALIESETGVLPRPFRLSANSDRIADWPSGRLHSAEAYSTTRRFAAGRAGLGLLPFNLKETLLEMLISFWLKFNVTNPFTASRASVASRIQTALLSGLTTVAFGVPL